MFWPWRLQLTPANLGDGLGREPSALMLNGMHKASTFWVFKKHAPLQEYFTPNITKFGHLVLKALQLYGLDVSFGDIGLCRWPTCQMELL
jgi:hypothetical protein